MEVPPTLLSSTTYVNVQIRMASCANTSRESEEKGHEVFCEKNMDGSLKATLADFGFAARTDDAETISGRCGTAGFIAPEIFRKKWTGYNKPAADILKIDVFSLGMVLLAMITARNPFIGCDQEESFQLNARGLPEGYLEGLPLANELKLLLDDALQTDPHLRCSISDVVSHPWLE